MINVLVPLAPGFEEIEAVTIIDVLRRAEINTFVASLDAKFVSGAHGLNIETTHLLEEVKEFDFDAIVCPGGMPGTSNLLESTTLKSMITKHFDANKLVAAICAAPWVLNEAGVLDGKKATCYPGFEEKLTKVSSKLSDRVVVDGNIVTSKGPGTAMEFALQVVSILKDQSAKNQLASDLIFQ